MKNKTTFIVVFLVLLGASGLAAERTPINIPDIMGYKTLKCDFHMHTVFSDGRVWPEIRVDEAWTEGLDVISITDHIEYQRHRDYVITNHNSSYEIAKPTAERAGILLVKGSEITRSMPPGHLNAIFLTNSAPLAGKDWREALQIAYDQGGFVFWNHPCWKAQQPDGIGRWYEEHSELFEKGILQGVEVINSGSYCPEAHKWAVEKNMTLLATSDIHPPIHAAYDIAGGTHRPYTLVFTREKSQEGIKEALEDRRTVLINGDVVIGREDFLQALFKESVEIVFPAVPVSGEGSALVQLRNNSDIVFQLEKGNGGDELAVGETLTLSRGKTSILSVQGREGAREGRRSVPLSFTVKNMWTAPEESLQVTLDIVVDFRKPPEETK